MPKHTDAEMEQMSFEDLKKNAAAPPEEKKEDKKEKPVVVAEEVSEEQTFLARREFDLGDGAGVEVFEAEGATEKDALDALADKIAEGKRNASKKIREQEAELRELRAKNAEVQKPKEISADDEYIFSQEFQKAPLATQRKMLKLALGYEVEDIAEAVRISKEISAERQNTKSKEKTSTAVTTFIATHDDYEDEGVEGTRNGAIMNQFLLEKRLPVTSENFHKAYLHLKQGGLLTLKGEKANSEATEETEETERIVPPKVDAAPQRTKKTSTIGTHSRTTAVPVSTEPSEAELYNMPLHELRARANKQMSSQ